MITATVRDELLSRLADVHPEPRGRRVRNARQRAELLCDPGSFHEFGSLRRSRATRGAPDFDGDGVVTGWGRIDGRTVAVASHEFSRGGGAIGDGFAAKITRLQDLAIERKVPIVYLNDSGGARINEGIEALDGCGEMFRRNVIAKGVVPQISVILGPCAGAAAYSPALTDWTIMVREQSHMFLTGPDVVRAAIGENVTPEDIGGADMHGSRSGVAHIITDSEEEALQSVRSILSFLPSHAGASLPQQAAAGPDPILAAQIDDVVPVSGSVPFDMRKIIGAVVDDSPTMEIMSQYAPSVVTLLARLGGSPVGVVASQPAERGGILDIRSSRKIARFVRFCGAYGLPIVTFVDVPGFMPGTAQESSGIITEGAEVLDAYVRASSPRLTVIVRKAYGGAFIAMGSKSLGADFVWSYPETEIAVMGPGGAVSILNRRDLAAAEDPVVLREELAADYRENVTRPFTAAQTGIVDDIIVPEQTREVLLAALEITNPVQEV